MFDSLLAFFGRHVALTDDQAALVRSLFVPRSFEKGQLFQRAGEVVARGGFVARGCFRTYAIHESGAESILFFSTESSWVGDIQSATAGTPTRWFVDAIEPSDVLTIDLPSFERLLVAIPAMARPYRLGLQRAQAAREQRLALLLQSSAEERYRDFLERQPAWAARVPQHMLASYLGMTPETLSRLRAKMRER